MESNAYEAINVKLKRRKTDRAELEECALGVLGVGRWRWDRKVPRQRVEIMIGLGPRPPTSDLRPIPLPTSSSICFSGGAAQSIKVVFCEEINECNYGR